MKNFITCCGNRLAKVTPEQRKLFFMLFGLVVFALIYFSPQWPAAIDPVGKKFILSKEGKGGIAIFMLAGIWWVFEVVPLGVTSLLIGVLQALFMVRPARDAFRDFMDPSVLFIFASIVIGMAFTRTGLTKRLAYKMLAVVGNRTSMIYLGCFFITAALTMFMAHTAVAATIYPLLMAIYSLYGVDPSERTRFGQGLFIGMAYVAGAGSVITLLGAARGAVALGFFKEITGREVSFFELTYYMFPVGWLMVFLLWAFFMLFFKPEKAEIPGLREKATGLYHGLGPMSLHEKLAALIVGAGALALSLRSFVDVLGSMDKAAILLITTILFFALRILTVKELEDIPWNIILLFSGAMSIGFCLWQTGAAEWMAINWLTLFKDSNWFVFLMSFSFFVMVMTNFIMNVAAIAISIPVSLVVAPYLGIAPEVVLFSALLVAGMPFLLLVGAAPNAIAYKSGLFSSADFFKYGAAASVLLALVTALAISLIWPLMGMPILS